MSHYKEQLLQLLTASGWELTETLAGIDWWAEEHWRMRSVRQNWGLEIFIHFKYDPMGFSGIGKHKVVLDIEATSSSKPFRISDKDTIAEMYLQKGKFKENMQNFVTAINIFRDGDSTQKPTI